MILTEQELTAQRRTAGELIATGRRLTRAHHDIVTGCADFADGVVWAADGSPSASHWLAERLDVCPVTVRSWIAVGRALRAIGATADAFKNGGLSYTKVRVLARIATPDNEQELLEIAREVPAAKIGQAVHAWSLKNEDHPTIDKRHRASRSMRSRNEGEGTVLASLRLTPLAFGIVDRAVEAQVMRRKMEREPEGHWPSLSQQRADAFVELLTANAQHRFEVVIHLDETGCYFPDGTRLTDSAVAALLDQASLRAIVHDLEGKPVNATRARRKPTVRQKKVASATQPTCSRCGTTDLLIKHHTVPHRTSQRTSTEELETFCAPCHREHHDLR
ncbi:MAG: DUF222 domain-containing protein [Actinomycetia bacterium]|nr:DUF222 domain-containing protein [Actinomycetes bacterium]